MGEHRSPCSKALCALLLLAAGACASRVEPRAELRTSPWDAAARSFDRLRARAQLSGDGGAVPRAQRCFMVNGWHWHNLLVQLHLDRLQQALESEPPPSGPAVQHAWAHLWTFSAVALEGTEGGLFFPWLAKELPPACAPAVHRLAALSAAEQVRGAALAARVKSLDRDDVPLERGKATSLARSCAELRMALTAKHAHALALAVPLVAAHLTAAEQAAFNQRVLSSLGIGAARLHLVGMHEVVEATDRARAAGSGGVRGWAFVQSLGVGPSLSSKSGGGLVGFGVDGCDQRTVFRARIPWVARSLIPRWRRLYAKRAGPLLCEC